MPTIIKKINTVFVVALLATVLGTVMLPARQVSADETLYKSGQQIKFRGIAYMYAGKNAEGGIKGWSIYLPKDWRCGVDIIVDNPDPSTADTAAFRGTKAWPGNDSTVLGACQTVDLTTQRTITNVTTSSVCGQAGGTWSASTRGSGCSFSSQPVATVPTAPSCGSVDSCERSACATSGGVWNDSSSSCKTTGTEINNQSSTIPGFIKNDCNGPNNQAGLSVDDENHCGILDSIVMFINILSALVGVVVVGSIIIGGIQYSTSAGDPQKVAMSKRRIMNAVMALFVFIFTYALLQYLVPGGVF